MKKKILSILLASMLIIMAFCSIPVGAEEETRAVSVYTGTEDYDFWDTALESDTGEVTIMTADQLMAFAVLSGSYNFEGWTIKLGADMVINTGDASTWGTEAPTYTWKCSTTWDYRFAGNFDGQGHVVSGLYSKYDQECGLFGVITGGSTIQNVSVVNSYFEYTANSSSQCFMGSIVGAIDPWNSEGKYDGKTTTIKNVYSNATLYTNCDVAPKSTSIGVGGIIGYAGNTSNHSFEIENAVYEGNITSTYRNTGGLIGSVMIFTSGATNIRSCHVNANIKSNALVNDKTDAAYVGGLIGYLSHTSLKVDDCIVMGTMEVGENNKYSSAFIGLVNPCADSQNVSYRRISAKNVLLAITPVATGDNDDVIFQSMLFNHNFSGSITVTFSNVKYDSSLYSYPTDMPHINKVGGNSEVTNGDFTATGATTEELKGQEVFTYWTSVSDAYPIPAGVDAPVIDMEFYKNAVDIAPSTPDGDGGNNDDNGGSNNGSTDNGGSNNGSTDNGGSNNSGSTDNGGSNNGSTDNGGSDNNDGTSNTDKTDNTPTTDTTSEKTGGCFASVGFAGISLLALVAVATIVISKKKVRN